MALEEHFDVVLHIPYCHTLNLINIDMDEITRQLFVGLIAKELEKRGLTKGLQRNKRFCLEEGECSLPSGRDGYPEEAMQIAGLLPTNQVEKKKHSIK